MRWTNVLINAGLTAAALHAPAVVAGPARLDAPWRAPPPLGERPAMPPDICASGGCAAAPADTAVAVGVRSFMDAIRAGTPEALRALTEERFTDALRGARPMERHLSILGSLSEALKEADEVTVTPSVGVSAEVRLSGPGGTTVVRLTIEAVPPHRIDGLVVE